METLPEKKEDVVQTETPKVVTPQKLESKYSTIPTSVPPPVVVVDLLKQSVERMLLFYCVMCDNQKQHKDFTESEMEAVQDMAINHIINMFPKLVDRKNDEVTRTRAINYLKLYYELYMLRQTESRRTQLLDHFSDVIRLGEMEEFFVETSVEFHQEIQRLSDELDKKIAPKTSNKQKQQLSLHDVVSELEEQPKKKSTTRRR